MRITDNIVSDFKAGKIEKLYTDVYPSLIVYASRQLGSDYAFLAEDCVQDAIYKMYAVRATFRNAAHFKAYLFAAIHNSAISVLRKGQSRQHYLEEKKEFDEDLQASIIEQETLDLLYSAIGRLPEDLRRVFDLSFIEGLKNEEVAAQLGCSVGTVKNRKASVLSFLRQRVGDEAVALAVLLYGLNV